MPPLPLPPGPSPLELLRRIRGMQTDPLGFLRELSQRYEGIAHFKVARLPVCVVHHPDGVKHVFLEEARRYSKDTIQYRSLASITGSGLLTSDGSFWRKQRRLVQPAFSKARIFDLDRIVVPATEAMLDRWDTLARTGHELNVDAEMMHLALEIVGRALFGVDLRSSAPLLVDAVLTTLDHIVHRARNVLAAPAFVPTPANVRFRAALHTLETAIAKFIDARRTAGELGDDLLGMLLRAKDEDTGAPLRQEVIRDEVLTMLIAGHETVAAALTWTFFLLASHETSRKRLRDEVASAFGNARPTCSVAQQLVYTGQVFSEALRLYPPAWVITRKAIEPDEVLGYQVPAGALVIVSPYVVHRLPTWWEHPEAFMPERFSPERSRDRHRFAFIPFGGGTRMCIGATFAEMEAKLILAMVSQRYELVAARSAPPVVSPLVTLRPRGGLFMRIVRC